MSTATARATLAPAGGRPGAIPAVLVALVLLGSACATTTPGAPLAAASEGATARPDRRAWHERLAEQHLIGELAIPSPLRAHLLGGAGEDRTLVLWSVDPERAAEVRLVLDGRVERIVDLDGQVAPRLTDPGRPDGPGRGGSVVVVALGPEPLYVQGAFRVQALTLR